LENVLILIEIGANFFDLHYFYGANVAREAHHGLWVKFFSIATYNPWGFSVMNAAN